ncbi:hypothetical protein GGR54DRAFT_634369 [Hypoxylon sp. NC1633]|nr:hypothetical protein GGR54DRAFT_634369 [Hypoxylon sp. NC1633]
MPVTQNATTRYLKEEKLLRLLQRLFPGRTDFNIRMRDDQWCFTVPSPVSECFVDRVTAPIQLIDVLPGNQCDAVQLSTAHEIEAHVSSTKPHEFSHRHLSICQRTSWSPLQVTRGLLELLVSKHDLSDSFWDLPSCFYHRNDDVEVNFCLPVTINRVGSSVEVSYTFRYPELKASDGQWAIRQTGLYYRFDTATSQTLSVLFSPTPSSAAHRKVEEMFLGIGHDPDALHNPLRIHDLLFATYFPLWRQYVAFMESKLRPVTGTTFATFIEEPLRVGYDSLSTLVSLENQFLQAKTLISHGEDVLRELISIFGQEALETQSPQAMLPLDNHRHRAESYRRTATTLQRRSQTTAQLLADTLSFRDQVLAKQQNGSMLQLNKSAVFLTTLTLLYLPASFVATFFGMNFFDLDQETQRIVSTPTIWIYAVSSIILTVVTFSVYYWVLHCDGTVVSKMQPKIYVGDWKGLTRRALTMRGETAKKVEGALV